MNKSFLIKLIVFIAVIVLAVCTITSIFVSENSDFITIHKAEKIIKKTQSNQEDKESFTDKIFSGRKDGNDLRYDEKQDDTALDDEEVDADVDADVDEPHIDGNDVNEISIFVPDDKTYLVLINKSNSVTDSFVPEDLILPDKRATDRAESNQYLVRTAALAFNELSEAAENEGYEIVVTTAYRSYGFQKILYDNYVAKDGQEAADRYSARPGTSEHQSGLAADVSSPSVNYKLTQEYANTLEGQWLATNCHNFGFVIRFPEGKEDITGYMYEPWHIRYVGKEVAEYIYENNLTLEEYIEAIE